MTAALGLALVAILMVAVALLLCLGKVTAAALVLLALAGLAWLTAIDLFDLLSDNLEDRHG